MRVNRIAKVFVWFIIISMLLSTLLFSMGWLFQ
ncbi:hypothetical protein BCM02_102409 [Paenibacillus methanolicus]|uniref:Stressosome-associated protein Prli42 n=1 Tax=Paenibacillus methanolicus TaxID=582686 RepID=A0A5S5CIK5_9BACL|nr:hypothetical protein BCM02_102409 [Paenibacillus methanolicus]